MDKSQNEIYPKAAFVNGTAAKTGKSRPTVGRPKVSQNETSIAPAFIDDTYLLRLSKADPVAFLALLGELLPQRT
jgi:hypothetical protein